MCRTHSPFPLPIPLFFPTYHRHQAANFSVHALLAAVGKEKIGAAHRAQRSGVNTLRGNTHREQLSAVRFQEIYPSVPLARWCETLVAIRKAFFEGVDDFASDFVATCGRRWSNRDAYIFP